MTLFIPLWLVWTLGIAAGLLLLLLSGLGAYFVLWWMQVMKRPWM